MYLNQNAKKQSESCFTYNLSQGIEGLSAGKLGKVISAMNLSSKMRPMISPRGRFFRWNYPNSAISTGSYLNNIYYNTADGFYFNGGRKGDLTEGVKTFVNFGDRIYIFPDRAYFDMKTNTFTHFYRSITANIYFHTGENEFEASYYHSSEGNLAEVFSQSKSIEISGSKNGVFDGCYKINSIDIQKGIVKFGHFKIDFEAVSDKVCTVSNAVPALEGACVCKNRIFGYEGNKIYACSLGDGMSWCDLEDESGSYRYENFGGDAFTACNTMEDQCVFFTNDKIFKIYGENVREFSLKMASGHGGIEDGFFLAHARVLGDIYFMNRNAIFKFSGIRSEIVSSLNENEISGGACFPYRDKLYFYYHADSGDHLCVLDADVGVVYEIDLAGVKGFVNLYDNICAVTDREIIALEGNSEKLPGQFVRDNEILSYVEFNEIHNGWDRFSPSKLYLRGKLLPSGELNIYCMLGNNGEWSHVYRITEEGEHLWEFSLPASLTDSFRLRLEGKGEFYIGNIYVLFS